MDAPNTTTRRQLLSGVVLAGGGSAAAAALIMPSGARAAQAPVTDGDLLRQLLAAELLAIAVYEPVIASGLLSLRPDRTARRALAQEHAHIRALTPALSKLGGTMPVAPATPADVDKQLAAAKVTGTVSKLRTEHDCVAVVLDMESVVIAAYFKAMSKLQDPGLLRLASQIMANEAQHATAISEARRPGNIGQAVPVAYVQGKH
jgi:ferritin-like protein